MARYKPDVEARRLAVAQGLLAHKSQSAIARDLGCSIATVKRDVAVIRADWQAERFRNYDEVVAEELSRLSTAEAAIWDQITNGKLFAIDRLLSIMERRAKLLGLDKPQEHVIRMKIEEEANRLAEEYGLDVSEVIAEAERLVKAGR